MRFFSTKFPNPTDFRVFPLKVPLGFQGLFKTSVWFVLTEMNWNGKSRSGNSPQLRIIVIPQLINTA